MAWTTDPRVMRIRRRHRVADIVVETLDGFARHLSGRDAAVLAYYGFLTIFPLFLAATTVLGFVLERRPDLEDDIVNSALAQVPFIGNDLAAQTATLTGSWWALTVGLVAALFASSKAFVGLQVAYDDVWEIPLGRRANFLTKRLRALIGIAVIGGSQVANVALAAIVDQAGLPRISRILILLGGLGINVVVVATMYRYLTAADIGWEQVWIGAIFTGVLYTTFQFAGTALATRLLSSAETYGEFAFVLALLGWLSLHALVNLYGAELNAALVRRGRADDLSPAERALAEAGSPMLTVPPMSPGDA